MRLVKTIKNVDTYIKDKKSKIKEDIITVEHRSNNPKRDYLFVNKAQCKHIPCSPSIMVDMCKKLTNEINFELVDKLNSEDNVLIVGFAETATAIGTIVANYLNFNTYIMHTTREEVEGSKELLRFEEEHSHATTQKLLTWDSTDSKKFINKFSYVLFVEDEISTGNTILNFIKAFKNSGLGEETNLRFGVASVCNWQNKENTQLFRDNNIDIYCLIRGELMDTEVKMLTEDEELEYINKDECESNSFSRTDIIDLQKNSNVFKEARLGYKNDSESSSLDVCDKLTEEIVSRLKSCNVQSIRIIGTEEFMDIPILVGLKLEEKGFDVICHSTTRSKIDILNSYFDGEADGIKNRSKVESAYEEGRNTYIYNTEEYTDLAIIISDSTNDKQYKQMVKSVTNALNIKPCNVIAYRI